MSEPPEVQTENRPQRAPEASGDGGHGRAGVRKSMVLALGVLGICYGDLGTSALYALEAAFSGGSAPLARNSTNVLGILSVVFWTLILVVSVKYMTFVLRADNRGEGGTFALIGLLRPWRRLDRVQRRMLVLLGLAGAAMLYAGMMITPAISILSAVEGLGIASPRLQHDVIPITIVILVALFAVQRFGTARIGAVFGPIMTLWFVVIAALGVYGIAQEPGVWVAINPLYALRFFQHDHWVAFLALFGIFLVTTGGEACYADIGHFGRRPIQWMWFCLVLPALLLNYFGQGAMLLHASGKVTHPFFEVVPHWMLYPTVALATVSTIIASQAVISGAYSMTRQAGRLGMMPRSRVLQTSTETAGQIYVPAVNWTLMVATIFLVLTFRSSGKLASVYGISVSTTMVVTTILMFFVLRERAHWKRWGALVFVVCFLCIDLAYFGSNLMRIPHGGWFPIAVAAVIFTVMSTWRRGGELLTRETDRDAKPLAALKQELKEQRVARVPGTAVFLTVRLEDTPPSLNHHVAHNHALQETVVLLTVLTENVPRTTGDERMEFTDLEDGFHRVVLHYGYMQQPNVPSELATCKDHGLTIKLDAVTYYIGHRLPTSRHGRRDGMSTWRDRLLGFMVRNSIDPTADYQLPDAQVLEMTARVHI
ncbi:MAG TPA: KUP/HAK/KT family potassium transporter [Nevskiaceae bacterium]